jgi:hypothetical protein
VIYYDVAPMTAAELRAFMAGPDATQRGANKLASKIFAQVEDQVPGLGPALSVLSAETSIAIARAKELAGQAALRQAAKDPRGTTFYVAVTYTASPATTVTPFAGIVAGLGRGPSVKSVDAYIYWLGG